MMMRDDENAFDAFKDISPRKQQPELQVLYDYEQHYMKLVRKYKGEIEFINDLLKNYRSEQEKFYGEILPYINDKLKAEAVSDDVREICLKDLQQNIQRSFVLSEKVITHYLTQKIEDFSNTINETLERQRK